MNGLGGVAGGVTNQWASSYPQQQQQQDADLWEYYSNQSNAGSSFSPAAPVTPAPQQQQAPQLPQPGGGAGSGMLEQIQRWYRLVHEGVLTHEQVELLILNQSTQGAPAPPLPPPLPPSPETPSTPSTTLHSAPNNQSQPPPPFNPYPQNSFYQQTSPNQIPIPSTPLPPPPPPSSLPAPPPTPSSSTSSSSSAGLPPGLQASLAAAARATKTLPSAPRSTSSGASSTESPPAIPVQTGGKKQTLSAGKKDGTGKERPTAKLPKSKVVAKSGNGKEKSPTQILAEGAPGMPSLAQLQAQLKPEQFQASLVTVMAKKGVDIVEPYSIDGKYVPLYDLYQAVMVQGGGYEQVDQTQSWDRICLFLSHPTSASFPIKVSNLYHSVLAPYEDIWSSALLKQREIMVSSVGGSSSSDERERERDREIFSGGDSTPLTGGEARMELPRLGLRFSEPRGLSTSEAIASTSDESRFEELPLEPAPKARKKNSGDDGSTSGAKKITAASKKVAAAGSSGTTRTAAGGLKKRIRENDDVSIPASGGLGVEDVLGRFYNPNATGIPPSTPFDFSLPPHSNPSFSSFSSSQLQAPPFPSSNFGAPSPLSNNFGASPSNNQNINTFSMGTSSPNNNFEDYSQTDFGLMFGNQGVGGNEWDGGFGDADTPGNIEGDFRFGGYNWNLQGQ